MVCSNADRSDGVETLNKYCLYHPDYFQESNARICAFDVDHSRECAVYPIDILL